MREKMIVLLMFCLLPSLADASGRRRSGPSSPGSFIAHMVPGPYLGKDSTSTDALAEVNAARAKSGLKAFLPDAGLNKAAQTQKRASRLIAGHLPESDFTCVPAGTTASAAGCGAWEPADGWGSCCTYDNYTYAGAAWAMGTDGRRYMHLFVSNSTETVPTNKSIGTANSSCSSGTCAGQGGIITRGKRSR